jgi:hypothetical protein
MTENKGNPTLREYQQAAAKFEASQIMTRIMKDPITILGPQTENLQQSVRKNPEEFKQNLVNSILNDPKELESAVRKFKAHQEAIAPKQSQGRY